ncbi:MAG TPA: heterodisulfide reductase-related iron-sulfur binding cluster [Gemmatimonadales bacterium]|nr:heterodisulfide reductase-related iron-sulfur binding cluster [Gemmatimonadales bacterium]
MPDVSPLARTRPECALPGSPLEQAEAGLDRCVHCGFCLQACPTYVTLEDENDSPRGRLVIMRALLDGVMASDDPIVHNHISQCLGCRGCETACPSGVPYGQLLEATRATLAESRPIPFLARFILGVFERPIVLKLAMLGARVTRALRVSTLLARLPGSAGFAFAMLESTRPVTRRRKYEPFELAEPHGVATMLEGCVMAGLFSHVNSATDRVVRENGWKVQDTPGQGCCGALHAHAGDLEGARRLARVNIRAFEQLPDAAIVVNSAGCGAMLKEYAHLLHDDAEYAERARDVAARVRDVSEVLAAAGPRPGAKVSRSVTYDAPCHLMHAQRVVSPPLKVLESIPGMSFTPLEGSDMCCGSAGIYNLLEPEVSDTVLLPKLASIAQSGAHFVATGNPGCLMQMGAGLHRAGSTVRCIHPVELLDESYAEERAGS